MFWFLFILCLSATNGDSSNLLKESGSAIPYAIYTYPQGVRSERDMPVCSSRSSACNLMHRRFWFPPIVVRLCRCAERSIECPAVWSDYKLNGNDTIQVDNRSQLKFCNDLIHLPQCTNGIPALNRTIRRSQFGDPTGGYSVSTETQDTQLFCSCPINRMWNHMTTQYAKYNNGTDDTTETYSCDKLPQCRPRQQCGTIRSDYYSTYYHCSCPTNHMCVIKNQQLHKTQELHYEGMSFKGICLRKGVQQ